MNILNTLRGLARRWYITVPGVILAVVTAVATWTTVDAQYQRTATLVLLPGQGTLPENASNPYLYLGGLSVVSDVIVRATGSEESLRTVLEEHPGTDIEITRDGTGGPVILVRVTAATDQQAADVVDTLVANTRTTLDDLQSTESIPEGDRVTITPLAIDSVGVPQQRNRIVVTAAAGGGVFLLAIVVASLVDGTAALRRRTRRREEQEALAEHAAPPRGAPADEDAEAEMLPIPARRAGAVQDAGEQSAKEDSAAVRSDGEGSIANEDASGTEEGSALAEEGDPSVEENGPVGEEPAKEREPAMKPKPRQPRKPRVVQRTPARN